uniref:Glucose oxidase n=1 Tax=Ganoderma boninense TaxID=34458 RepID=A0A5K1JZY1_9APHY
MNLPSTSAIAVSVSTVLGTIPAPTKETAARADKDEDEDEDDEDVENNFRLDNDVIGGLIMDPIAPPPTLQPIPPIVAPLLPPLHVPVIPVPVAQALPVLPPQPNISNILPPQAYMINIHIVRTICTMIPLLELYLTMELTFPDSFVTAQFISFTLVSSAAKLRLSGLVTRQMTDPDFLRVMVNLDNQLSANWKMPYLYGCVTAILHAAFAAGPNLLVAQHPEILVSTNSKHPNEREIPMVMLALVGTAIHAALSD